MPAGMGSTAIQAGTNFANAAIGAVGVGGKAALTAVNLAGGVVGFAGTAGQAGLKSAGAAAEAAAQITSAASKAAATVGEGALKSGADVSVAALTTAADLSKQVLGTIGKTGTLVTALVDNPLEGLTNFLNDRSSKYTQVKGSRTNNMLIDALVAFYSKQQAETLGEIRTLVSQRLILANQLREIFKQAHCKKVYLVRNRCDTTWDGIKIQFIDQVTAIDRKLKVVESQLLAFTIPLKYKLHAALAGKSDISTEERNQIYVQLTAEHSAKIEAFFTEINAACDAATQLYAADEEKALAVPPSLPTHPVQIGVTPNANMQNPNPNANQNGGRRRTTRTKRHRLRKTRNSRPIRRSKTVHRKQRRTRRS